MFIYISKLCYPAVRTSGGVSTCLFLDPGNVEQIGVCVEQGLGHQGAWLHLGLLLEAGALPDELHHRDCAGNPHARYQHHEHAAHAVQSQLVGVVALPLVLGVALAPAPPLLPPPVLELVQFPLLLKLENCPVYWNPVMGARGEGNSVPFGVKKLANLPYNDHYYTHQTLASLTWMRSHILSI